MTLGSFPGGDMMMMMADEYTIDMDVQKYIYSLMEVKVMEG